MRFIYCIGIFFVMACSSGTGSSSKEEEKHVFQVKDNGKEIVCFVYHRFGDHRYPSTNISIADFEAHLYYLQKNQFQVLTLSEAISYLHSDVPSQKTAVLTVDDGYASFLQNALPVLKKFSIPVTLFINTESVGGGDYMNWDELKQCQEAGMEIGNHTHSHAYFLNQHTDHRYINFEKEIDVSQKMIRERLSITPQVFAYPYGEVDKKMQAIISKKNFVCAVAQNSGVICTASEVYQLPRFPMSESYAALSKFKEKIGMHALRVTQKSPQENVIENMLLPTLTVSFPTGKLQLDRLQCFIQGTTCTWDKHIHDDQVEIVLFPGSKKVTRRRTLYTITVPDEHGEWYWFSHLVIQPSVP